MMKMFYFKLLLQLLGVCVLTHGLPSSLMEDIKDAEHHSVGTNKVKRAQEYIMFGNQQNRASYNLGKPKNEKRAATGLGENSIIDDDERLPRIRPQSEEEGYQSNQLGFGGDDRLPYSQIHDLYYNLLLRNMEMGQQQGLEYPLYNYMEGRPKRETKTGKAAKPKSFRMKREYALNPEDLLAVMRMWESEKASRKYPESRPNYYHYGYETEDNDEDDLADTDDAGMWYNAPVPSPHGKDRDLWARPHKRFMVSKRQYDGDLSPYNGPYDFMQDGIPLYRRFLL